MIPKIIHLCWFSGDPYPPLIKKCVESWGKVMPDYRVEIWDEKKARSLNNKFVNQAIDQKKYAFAADFVRLHALYEYGGIYLDSDIYLKQSLEPLLKGSFVSFMEYHPALVNSSEIDEEGNRKEGIYPVSGIGVQAACMASEPHHPLIRNIMKYYEKRNFIKDDGSLDMNVIAPAIFANKAEDFGFKYIDKLQNLEEGGLIYPSELLSGGMQYEHSKAYGIHCCQHSWFKYTPWQKIKKRIKKSINKLRGKKDFLA